VGQIDKTASLGDDHTVHRQSFKERMPLFEELKRRNVFRVGLAYLFAAWLLLQVADVVLGNIAAPDWVFKTVLLLVALGLPVALMFAWAFEMTPDGLKREKDVDRTRSVTHITGRKLDRVIMLVLVLAVGYFALDKFYFRGGANGDPASAAQVQHNSGKATHGGAGAGSAASVTSIAVLPFVNMSSDKEQDYFSDGISEELLNLLAKIPAFRVAGRTSSFAFKGKNEDLRSIGDSLGVSTILEGSVRKGANRVRITAQLVKVDDGFHLWSETYDRELTDVLAVQDEIAGAVVRELKVTLLGEQAPTQVTDPLTDNPEAYNAYLQGLYFYHQGGPDNNNRAMLALASGWYAAQASDVQDALDRAREALARALALDDSVPEVQLAVALMQLGWDWDWAVAETAVERALAQRPGDVPAQKILAWLKTNTGQLEQARDILNAASLQDPLDLEITDSIGQTLTYMGDYAGAETVMRGLLAKNPTRPGARAVLARALLLQGRLQEALESYQAESIRYLRLTGLAITRYELGDRTAAEAARQELWEAYGKAASYQQAQIFASWGQPDEAIKWLDTAYTVRDPGMQVVKGDPQLASLKNEPGYQAIVRKMGLAD
jgi:adenylate cyclase